MEMIFCPNCKKLTGYKRALGFGTLFAVLLTAGFWLIAIPFYPKRCITCGLKKSDSVSWYKTWQLGFVVALVLIGIGVATAALLFSRTSKPALMVQAPNHEASASSSPISSAAVSPDIAPQPRHKTLGLIVPASDIPDGEQLLKPPLNITVVSTDNTTFPNGGYEMLASARFSDAFLAVGQKKGMSLDSMRTFRFGLLCGGSRPGCLPLNTGQTYWMQFIHRGDAGYYHDQTESEDCNLARFGDALGKEATAVYYVCIGSSNTAQ
jgi:hypothetical protein